MAEEIDLYGTFPFLIRAIAWTKLTNMHRGPEHPALGVQG
jgi:hypothetical protein